MRLRVALERAQLYVLLVGRGGLALELVEAGAERLDARAGDLGVVFERACEPIGLGAQLALEIGNLRAQFLDAGMLVEQRGGLLGKLGPQRDALLGQPAQQFGIRDVGELTRRAGAQDIANDARLGLGVGLLRACGGNLAI